MKYEEADETNTLMEIVTEEQDPVQNTEPVKRTYASSGRPRKNRSSYNVQMEHRRRLTRLLGKLMSQQNWKEACGVMSVLLQATRKDTSCIKNRLKYTAAMELLYKLNEGQIGIHSKRKRNKEDIAQEIYGIWTAKNKSMRSWPAQDKYLVMMEYLLHCLTRESSKLKAQNAVENLKQHATEKDFASQPVSNMLAGLMYYKFWYLSIQEELKLRNSYTCETPTTSETSEMHSRTSLEIENSKTDGQIQNVETDTSIADNKTPLRHSNAEGNVPNYGGALTKISIFRSRGVDTCLLPMPLRHLSEQLEKARSEENNLDSRKLMDISELLDDAVTHLRSALRSSPPVLASLLPLVQLLVMDNRVEEASEELEALCQRSTAALPSRLRAIFVEGDHTLVSKCYEDALKRDPTDSDSLTELITMHNNDFYSSESLMEMIALHLDATYAPSNVWGEFALCFLRLPEYEEDQMSVNGNTDEGESKKDFLSTRFTGFIKGKFGKPWRIRCRWWSTRHFSLSTYLSEMQTGDMKLLTYKAACASHFYGPKFEYVINVYTHLEREDNDLLFFLQSHMKKAVNLSEHLDGAN